MRVPKIVAGAVMSDACQSGAAPGTAPGGEFAAAKLAIHPDKHSADICCSVAVSFCGQADPKGDPRRRHGDRDGLALAEHIAKTRPETAIVVTSGRYAMPPDGTPSRIKFLPKPWTAEELSQAIGAPAFGRSSKWMQPYNDRMLVRRTPDLFDT